MISSTKRNGMSGLFKGVRNEPKGFNYTPRYYDEDAERLERRKEVIEKEMEAAEKKGAVHRVSEHSATSYINANRRAHARASKVRLMRLVIILAVILSIGKVLWEYLGL